MHVFIDKNASKSEPLCGKSVHSNGTKFFAPKSLSNGLYIEVHAGTEQLLNNTYKLLERFGVSKERLRIKEDMKALLMAPATPAVIEVE